MEETMPSVVEGQVLYCSSCGYCKSKSDTSVAYGLWSQSLSLHDYQDLLDQGWSRDGMFLYRPVVEKSCCKAYTIRLKVDSFYKSKEQIRVLRRMERYLDGTYNGPSSEGKTDSKNKMICKTVMNSGKKSGENSMSNKTRGSDCASKSKDYLDADASQRSTKDLMPRRKKSSSFKEESELDDETRGMDLGDVESQRLSEVPQKVEVGSKKTSEAGSSKKGCLL